jgi:hypothetical protein
MDSSPRALSKWLPYLAAALAMASIVAMTPPFTGDSIGLHNCMGALIHVPEIAILLGLSIAVPVMTSGGPARMPCQRLLYGTALALAATAVGRFVDVDVTSDAPMAWLFLEALGALLLALGGPGIWGSAVAREEDLASPQVPRVARVSAAVTFTGFLAFPIAKGAFLLSRGPAALFEGASAAAAILPSIALLAGRGLLLWASVESWKPCLDEGLARERARRIKRLMIPSVLAGLLSSILSAFLWQAESHGYGHANNRPMLVWHGFVQFTLTILGAILVALALETPISAYEPRKKGPFFPQAPPAADSSPIDVP